MTPGASHTHKKEADPPDLERVRGVTLRSVSGLRHSGQGARGPSLDALNREPVEANNADHDFRRATDHQLTILRLSTDHPSMVH